MKTARLMLVAGLLLLPATGCVWSLEPLYTGEEDTVFEPGLVGVWASTDALAVVKEIVSNRLLALAVERLGDGVKRGAGLSAPMGESGVFPPLALHMVRVGEETGRLEEMLLKVADAFEAEVRSQVKRFITLLEPGIIVTMAVVVGFIVLAIAMAILSINEIPL